MVAVPKRLERKVLAVLWCRDVLLTPSCCSQVFTQSDSLLALLSGQGGGDTAQGVGQQSNHGWLSTVATAPSQQVLQSKKDVEAAAAAVTEEGGDSVADAAAAAGDDPRQSTTATKGKKPKAPLVPREIPVGRVLAQYSDDWIDEVVVPALLSPPSSSSSDTVKPAAFNNHNNNSTAKGATKKGSNDGSATTNTTTTTPVAAASVLSLPVFVRGIAFTEAEDDDDVIDGDCEEETKATTHNKSKSKKNTAKKSIQKPLQQNRDEFPVFTLSNAAQPYPQGVYYCSDNE